MIKALRKFWNSMETPRASCSSSMDDLGPSVIYIGEIRERGKIRLELVPAAAMRAEAIALDAGNKKDGRTPFNWRQARVSARDQLGGLLRHAMAWQEGEEFDAEGVHHLGAVRARAGIILDAQAHGTLIDDRVIGKRGT